MADELAKVLEIPDAVTAKMTDVTKKIKEIEDASNTMAIQVNAAWKTLANGDIDSYLQKLKEVQTASSSSKIAIDSTDITKAATEAEKWADAMQRVVEQASNYAATKTATYAVQQEWNEALKALKLYKEAELRASEMGMAVPQEAQDAIAKVKERVAELEETYGELAKSKKAAWAASDAKLEIQSAERVAKKKQQQIEAEKRLEHTQLTRALKVEAANNRVLILAEKLSREQGKSQHYAGLIAELQRLQDEYKKLGNTKADAERRGQLEQEMEQVRKSIQSADSSMRGLSNTTRGLFNYADQLSRAFALLFSVSQIRNYIRQIKDVTAEFEKQKIALGSLLQSQDKANELFGQITNLAVRSPFTIKELNSYTKQLAAYNIQYENLFDTTKMLADVSAGLGVDMQRLILAFGQVKAATVLRGTEVRQFTEAGFGILGELAKYYTELEGRLVSVGDVQDRITKKMVKFADVEEIFKRVTSAGGMFYNMQEKLAQTLAGRWSNLTDRIELMMNEIGQSNMAIFNALIGVASTLAENWELVATALSLAVPAFASFKVQSAMAARGLTLFGKQASITSLAVKGLSAAVKSLLSPLSLALIAIEGVVWAIGKYNDAQEEAKKRTEEFTRNMSVVAKASRDFQDIANAEKNANESDEEFADRQYDEKKKALQSLRLELEEIGVYIKDLPDIKTLSSEEIDKEVALLQERATAWTMFGKQLSEVWDDMGGKSGNKLKKASDDLNESFAALNESVLLNIEPIKNALLTLKGSIGEAEFEKLYAGLERKPNEDFITYANRLRDTLSSMMYYNTGQKEWVLKFRGGDENIRTNIIDNILAAKGVVNKFIRDYDVMTEKAETAVTTTVEEKYKGSADALKSYAEKHPILFKSQFDRTLADEQITGFAKEHFEKQYYIHAKVELETPNLGGDNLTGWRKTVADATKGIVTDKNYEDTLNKFGSISEYVNSLISELNSLKKETDGVTDATVKAGGAFESANKDAVNANNERIDQINKILSALGVIPNLTKKETKEAKTRNDYLKESVSLIEKMGKEYDDALDSMGKTAAKTDISTRYSSLLSDLADKAGMDGTAFVANLSFDTSGIISALQKVADAAAKAGATEAEQAAREAIAKIQGEDVKIEVKANVEGFERELDNVLAQYQLGKELSKLGLGKELTESLFNFESIDLDTARAFVEKFKATHTDANGEIANDYKEAYEKALKEVTNLENKELQERLKSYQKYLKQSMSDAVAIKLEEARQLDEINKMEIDAATKAQLREGVKRETSEKYDKAKWEEFKNSDMYIQMFEDLDYMSTATLHRLRNRLIEIKDSLHDLSPESLKEIQSQFDKIDEVITQRNPFKELAKSLKAVNDLRKQGRTREVIEEEIEAYDVKLQQTQQEIQLLEKYIGLQQQVLSLDNLTEAEKAKLVQYQGMQGLELQENLDSLKEYYDIIKLVSGQASFELTQWDDLGKDLDGVTTKLGLWGQQWDKVAETAKEALDMMGVDSDSIANTFIDLGTNLKDIGLSALQQAVNFKAMGIAANSALGVIGWIAIALQGIVTIFSSLFKAHDKRLENQIEMHLENVEELERAYEDLEKSIESAYSSSTYDQAQDDAIANLEAQNKALERAQAAERDKKKTDQDRIDEWEQQKLDNLEKIAELERQAIEAYGGFGSDDNIKSAAEDFVSAWLDAFNETGNGLDALSDKMDEWLNNAIQKQLLMRLSEQYITPLLSQFDQMFEETSDMGRQMSQAELEAWKKIYEKNSKEFDEKAKAYLNALDIKPTGAESELSGLQRGIEGVTETTAQALEALLNSMRYYVSDSNNLLRQFYMSFISADETMNPMLYELKQHTTLLNAIHTLLNSTTKMTNNNGRALKVLMM